MGFGGWVLRVCLGTLAAPLLASAASVLEVLPLTDRVVMVHFGEGRVIHSQAGQPWGPESVLVSVLNTNTASQTNSYQISSTNDPAYAAPLNPIQVGRKSKGTDFAWNGDPAPRWTKEHWLYLKLPQAMQTGRNYTIDTGSLGSNGRQWPLTFDEKTARSEAVHVNLLGYVPGAPQKFAYVFHWAGDLGSLSLASYSGRTFRLIDQQSGATAFSGALSFRKSATQTETGQAGDTPNANFLGAEVYECNFSSFNQPGQYIVAVDGIGCSFPFRINADIYREAFPPSRAAFTTTAAELPSGRRSPPLPARPRTTPPSRPDLPTD